MIARVSLFIAGAVLSCFQTMASAQTRLENDCFGANPETCFTYIDGRIEKGLTERFTELHDGIFADQDHLIINSVGGNLGEAIRFGRLLRKIGWRVTIGSFEGAPTTANGNLDLLGRGGEFPKGGNCESACAYLFMGGEERAMASGSTMGFHRFQAPGREIDSETTQSVSGELISYIIEMGVDPRVFVVASKKNTASMHYLSETEAQKYDLTTPTGFAPFHLEPYKNGVLATAKRNGPLKWFDYVDQITAFCRNNEPVLVFFASQHGLNDAKNSKFTIELDQSVFEVPSSGVTLRVAKQGAYLSVRLPGAFTERILSANKVETYFNYPMTLGGSYGVRLELSEMDRASLSAAFRFCIN